MCLPTHLLQRTDLHTQTGSLFLTPTTIQEGVIVLLDLHIHTACSDGRLTMDTIGDVASQNETWSVTDHDSIDFYRKCGNVPITGVELSSYAVLGPGDLYPIEVLAYGFHTGRLREKLGHHLDGILPTQTAMLADLKEKLHHMGAVFDDVPLGYYGIPYAHYTLYETLVRDPANRSILGPVLSSADHFYYSSLASDSPLCVDLTALYPSLGEIRSAVIDAGGLLFLAHPFRYLGVEAKVLAYATSFMDGFECIHNPTATTIYRPLTLLEYCSRHRLWASAGTDYHSGQYRTLAYPSLVEEYSRLFAWTRNLNTRETR